MIGVAAALVQTFPNTVGEDVPREMIGCDWCKVGVVPACDAFSDIVTVVNEASLGVAEVINHTDVADRC